MLYIFRAHKVACKCCEYAIYVLCLHGAVRGVATLNRKLILQKNVNGWCHGSYVKVFTNLCNCQQNNSLYWMH